ncbi:restriction endonuclease subunit S [Vibrio alginolyticus]
MDNWRDSKIKELCTLHYGKSPKGIDSDDGIYPIYGTGGRVGSTNEYLYDKPSIILGRKGSIGNIHYVDKPFWTIDTTFYVEAKNCDPKWLYYLFSSLNIEKLNEATGVPSLSRNNIYAQMLKAPSDQKEQQKIAEVLSTVDKKIDLIDQKIAETEKLKTGLMQKLFSEGVGVQDENGDWQPHTEFYLLPTGEYPQAWQPKTLNDVCEKIGDGIHTTPKYVEDSEYRFVNGNNIKNGKLVITKKTKCVSKNEYDKHKKELSLDTILLSINGTIGSLAYYDGSSIVLGKSAAYLSPKEMIQKEFLYYYLSTSNVSKWFAMGLTGTTIKNLSLKTIRNTPIAIPHLKEQAAITSILTEVDKKVALLKAQKIETQQLKKGLMQKLLTGEWRVPVEETEGA